MSENHWDNKSIYLENVKGSEIVAKQSEINNTNSMFVVATQVFQLPNPNHIKWCAFIYYKSRFGNIKGLE